MLRQRAGTERSRLGEGDRSIEMALGLCLCAEVEDKKGCAAVRVGGYSSSSFFGVVYKNVVYLSLTIIGM